MTLSAHMRAALVRRVVARSEAIPGGTARGMSPSDFDAKELAKGVKVEQEHLVGGGYTAEEARAKATEIAMDHLAEIPDYYTRLLKMESEAGVKNASMAALDHVGLLRLLREKANRRIPRWEPLTFQGHQLEIINPDPSAGSEKSLRVRFPGSPDQFQWSVRTRRWRKSRKPVVSESPKVERAPLSAEERAFYNQTPDEMLQTLRGVPRSALPYLDMRKDLLPDKVIRFLESSGFRFPKTAKLIKTLWLVTDPTPDSEIIDILVGISDWDRLRNVMVGSGPQWSKDRPAFHDDFNSAYADAMNRLRKIHGRDIPDWVLANSGSEGTFRMASRVAAMSRVPEGTLPGFARNIDDRDLNRLRIRWPFSGRGRTGAPTLETTAAHDTKAEALREAEQYAKSYERQLWPGGMASVVAVIEFPDQPNDDESGGVWVAVTNTYYSFT